jgi:hypothetical protein
MKVEIRTLKRAISTLVVLCVLFVGMALDVSAQRRGRDWGRSHNRGRHLGWSRGRRVGQQRRDDDRRDWRRRVRRNRRAERRTLRRQRRSDWDNIRNWGGTRDRQSSNWRRRNY